MKQLNNASIVTRRDFLKLALTAFGGAAVAAVLPATGVADVQASKMAPLAKYRGTRDGRIESSRDGGRSWRVEADFGPDYRVRRVIRGRKGVKAELIFQGNTFYLTSVDGHVWVTDGFQSLSAA